MSVLSGEREVELLEGGQLPAFFFFFWSHSCVVFMLVLNLFLFGWIAVASLTPLNPPHPSRLTSAKTFSILRNSITTELAIFADALNDKCSNGL